MIRVMSYVMVDYDESKDIVELTTPGGDDYGDNTVSVSMEQLEDIVSKIVRIRKERNATAVQVIK